MASFHHLVWDQMILVETGMMQGQKIPRDALFVNRARQWRIAMDIIRHELFNHPVERAACPLSGRCARRTSWQHVLLLALC